MNDNTTVDEGRGMVEPTDERGLVEDANLMTSDPSPRERFKEFLLTNHQKDPRRCIELFERVMIHTNLSDYWIYSLMSGAYVHAGQTKMAFLLASLAEKIEPGSSSWHLYHRMYQYLIRQGREHDAIYVLLKHLQKNPENPIAGADEINSLLQRRQISRPEHAGRFGKGSAPPAIRRIAVVEASSQELNVRKPINGRKTLALRHLGQLIIRPKITVTELLDATVIIRENAVLILDSHGSLRSELSSSPLPEFVLDKVLRQAADGLAMPTRDTEIAVLAKDHFSSSNLCHFLLDYMTRLELYRRAGAEIERAAVITEAFDAPFMKTIAAAFGVAHVIDTNQILQVRVGRLFISDNCKETFCHPAHNAAPWALDYIRSSFGIDVDDGTNADLRIYISRRDARERNASNEEEVAELLTRFGFLTLVASEVDYLRQVALFRRATHVVGLHGAGLANIVFCAPGTHILEIFHPIGNNPDYAIVAAGGKLNYDSLVGEDGKNTGAAWNDAELPETARDEVGGVATMNGRDIKVPILELERWLTQVIA